MYRVFTKPEHSHEWGLVLATESQAEALHLMDTLSHDHSHKPGRWCVRNTRGEAIARVTVGAMPAASTYWSVNQLVSA